MIKSNRFSFVCMLLAVVFAMPAADTLRHIEAVAADARLAKQSENGKNGRGFSRPEEALVALMHCLRKFDIPAALDLFAIDEEVAGYDFSAYIDRGACIFMGQMGPAEYPGFVELNRIHVLSFAARQVRLLVYSLLLPEEKYEELLDGQAMCIQGDKIEGCREFIAALNPAGLKKLAIRLIVPLNPEEKEKQKYFANLETLKKAVGCEDIREFGVFYELDGVFYQGVATMYQYNGKWLIHNLGSGLMMTRGPGRAVRMTQQQADFVFK